MSSPATSVPFDRSGIRRILVIKLRAIGDVLLSTIVTKNLRLAFPSATIHFLTERPSAEVVRGNPFLDAVMVYDRGSDGSLELLRRVRRGRYDLVIDLFGNPRTALVTRVSGARVRVGFRFRGRSYAYNVLVEPRGSRVHNTQFNLDALEALGVAITDRNLYFQLDSADTEYVEEFLKAAELKGKPLAALSVSGGWYTKRWRLDRFALLADRINRDLGFEVVLMWGPGERGDVEAVKGLMRQEAFIAPPTTLKQLGALFQHCRFAVCNDSGPMHIAAAVGVPVLGIYGPTNPVLQGPYGEQHLVVRNESLTCLGCNLTTCPIGHPCMLDLSVETVFASVESLIQKNNLYA